MDLALDLFTERGYPGTSMDELARRAGVSKPVIYDLVGNKEALFRRCVQRVADDLAAGIVEAVGGAGTWEEQLYAGGLAFFRFVAGRRAAWDVMLSASSTAFATDIDNVRERQALLIATLLRDAAQQAGVTFGADEDEWVDGLAHALNGAYEQMATWWAGHEHLDPETVATWLADIVVPGLVGLVRARAKRLA